jgi:raffinose/stachyose/melibiose transport system permease protein
MIFMSFKSNIEIFGGNIMGPPLTLRWENYKSVMNTGNILVFFANSVLVTTAAIAAAVFFSAMTSYAVARMRWRGRRTVLNIFLLGIMIPSQAIILPIYMTMYTVGLYNTRLSLIIVYTVFLMPITIYILAAYMKSLPKELEESATIDGAGIFYIFFLIILPIIRPAIASVIIISFLSAWNEFMYAFILVDNEKLRTLTVGLMSLRGQYNTNWGAMGAGMVIATFPTVITYLFMSKNIQNSLIAGSIKE